MTPTLTLSGTFDQPGLDSLCDELRELPKWSSEETACVDLRALNALDPTPLAVLLASLNGLYKRQLCDPLKNFKPPRDGHGAACLNPQRLNDLFAEGSGHWETVQSDPLAILGCECFSGLDGVDSVTRGLYQQLAIHTDWSSSSLKSVGSMIFELSENVIQHSQAAGGIAVLRICQATQRIALVIADSGIGIRESLARNPDYIEIDDDLAAIAKAMGPRTTGEPGTGGGMGLFLARCLVRSNGGTFMVRSGEACREESDTLCDSPHLPPLHGTLVSVEARTDLPFEYDKSVEAVLRKQEAAAATG